MKKPLPPQKRHAKVVACLLSDPKERIRWRGFFARDGVRLFWFDEADDLLDFLDDNEADFIVVNIPDLDQFLDLETIIETTYCLSANPDDIDKAEGYGHIWMPSPLTAESAKSMLNG